LLEIMLGTECPVTDLLLGYIGYFELKWICQGGFLQWLQLFASTDAFLTHLTECNVKIYEMVIDGWRRPPGPRFHTTLFSPGSHLYFPILFSLSLPCLNKLAFLSFL
jgi:hypothetical protein